MIQQTFHKSMFTRARSNSVDAIPKDISTHDKTLDIENKNETKENKIIWQHDRIPPAKRKRTETSSPLTENEKKKSNATIYTIPTQNHFEILGDEEDIEIEKPPKPEPIFVTGVLDINYLKKLLLKITTEENYTMTTLRSGHIVKIVPINIEVYKSIRDRFITDNISHYTYKLKCERSYRVVLRGLHSSEDTSEISEALKQHGHEARQVVNVRHRTSKEPLPIFYVDLEPKPNNKDIFKLKSLNQTKVTFEAPYKKKEILQCKRCQRFGHSKNQCYRPFRCVKCGSDHPTTSCTKTRDTEATCANCQAKHPANYRGCIKYKEYKERILKIQPKTLPNKQPKLTAEEDKQQTGKSNIHKSTITYAEMTKNKTANMYSPNQPLEIQHLGDILEQMFNRLQTMMLNMVNNMMDRFVQLVNSQTKIQSQP